MKENSLLQVIVTDDGLGFSIDNMSYIVDFMNVSPKFKQQLPKAEGIGMGLHICKEIIAKLGGKIVINMGYNRLTSFKIQIPSQLPETNVTYSRIDSVPSTPTDSLD